MAVTVGTLTIDLTANTSSFNSSMTKMSTLSAKTASDIKRSLETIATAGIAMGAALVAGTSAAIMSALDTADAMLKMAQSAGTTTETLSVLGYAASLSNVSMEDLGKGLVKLSVNAFKAQNGNVQLSRVFSKLGVDIYDANGKLKDSGLLMEEIAVKFSKMGDSSGKTALSVAIFSKAGAGLIPLLNQYGAAQKQVNDEAHEFGLVLSTTVAEAAGRAHDDLDRFGAMARGIGISLLSAVLPQLEKLASDLIGVAKSANLPDLARAFGEHVTTAIRGAAEAMAFAAKNAHALEAALVALAALKVAKIALPVLGDLAAGGTANLGAGMTKAALSATGMTSAVSAIPKILASIPSLLAGLANPFVIAAAVITAAGAAAYYFRDSLIEVNGTSYKLRDTWAASLLLMGKATTNFRTNFSSSTVGIRNFFSDLVTDLKSLWGKFIGGLSSMPIAEPIVRGFNNAKNTIEGIWHKIKVPQVIVGALDQAKAQREAKEAAEIAAKAKAEWDRNHPPKLPPPLPPPDTKGLGKEAEQDPKVLLMAELQARLAASQLTLEASGKDEEAQRKATAANKANAEILKLGEEIAKKAKLTTKDFASLVDQGTQATIRSTEMTLSDKEARAKLNQVIGDATRLSNDELMQAALMITATREGTDAVLRQTAATQAWNELRAKGGSIAEISARSQELYATAVARENVTLAGSTKAIRDDIAARQIQNAVTLGSIDAQRAAALQAQLLPLSQRQQTDEVKKNRQAIIDRTAATNEQTDREAALALLSPADKYIREADALNHATAALAAMQGGQITYAQQLEITNKQIDSQVNLLLSFGDARSGVDAFFLDMQKSAITTGRIIYDALHQTFERLSSSLTELVTGGHADFGKMFADVGKQMVNSSITKGLQSALGAAGKALGITPGGVLGSSESNPMWTKMVGGLGSAGGSYLNELGDMIPSTPSSSSSSDSGGGGGFGKAAKGILGTLLGVFGGGMAHGGTVSPNKAYMVGEKGPEPFFPSVAGSLSPAGSFGGDQHFHIDARGATDPAQVQAAVHRAMGSYGPQLVQASVDATRQAGYRSPTMAR